MNKKKYRSYLHVLHESQHTLSKTERTFSRIVHSHFMSTLANILENTVFRPIPLITGLSFSILSGCVLFAIAVVFGYAIYSLESLGFSFILGFMAGIIYEYLRALTKNPKE